MKHLKPIYSFFAVAAFVACFTFVSCSKDNNTATPASTQTDVRDLAVGTYTGNANIKDTAGNTVLDTSTSFVIAKGAGNSVTITEDGVTITTDAIVASGNDFYSIIPSQTGKISGQTVSIRGKGANDEQFGFQAAQKVVIYNFEIIEGPFTGYTYSVFGTKK